MDSARQRGRDARRATDLRQLQVALELYAVANPSTGYPGTLVALRPSYIGEVPTDPRNGSSYIYAIKTVAGTNVYYCIGAYMELAAPSPDDTCDDTPSGLGAGSKNPALPQTGLFPYNVGP